MSMTKPMEMKTLSKKVESSDSYEVFEHRFKDSIPNGYVDKLLGQGATILRVDQADKSITFTYRNLIK